MKKLLIFLLLTNIFNCNFAAQVAQTQESKVDQKKINQLENLVRKLSDEALVWNNKQISEQINKIKAHFNSGIDVNIVFKSGDTPLTSIANNKHLNELAYWLINNGADVNKVATLSQIVTINPLYIASQRSNLGLMEVLINKGANVNFSNSSYSVLYCALFPMISLDIETRKAAIKLLLINGAIFNDEEIQNRLKRNNQIEYKKIFEEVIKEIGTEYRTKINAYNKGLSEQLPEQLYKYMPRELGNIVQQYIMAIPNYTDDEIIKNILDIRKTLGELDDQDRPVQIQAAAAAAANPLGGAALEQQAPEPQLSIEVIHEKVINYFSFNKHFQL